MHCAFDSIQQIYAWVAELSLIMFQITGNSTVCSPIKTKHKENIPLLALCEGNLTVPGGFPSHRASNAEYFHAMTSSCFLIICNNSIMTTPFTLIISDRSTHLYSQPLGHQPYQCNWITGLPPILVSINWSDYGRFSVRQLSRWQQCIITNIICLFISFFITCLFIYYPFILSFLSCFFIPLFIY